MIRKSFGEHIKELEKDIVEMGRMVMEVERAMRSDACKIELFSRVGGAYPTPAEILEFILIKGDQKYAPSG